MVINEHLILLRSKNKTIYTLMKVVNDSCQPFRGDYEDRVRAKVRNGGLLIIILAKFIFFSGHSILLYLEDLHVY